MPRSVLYKDTQRSITSLIRVFLLSGLVVIGSYATGQDNDGKKVLFVGNSYTYFWNLPQHVAIMADEGDMPLITRQSTIGGSNLGQHWRGDRKLESKNHIENGDFDIVVIQDHSMRSIEHPDSLLHFGQLFGEIIRKSGARPYVYMTWAREYDPYMQEAVTKTYYQLAQMIDAEVVPVGLAWQRALELRPGLPLYDPDGSHPSPMGTYLSACVFYGKLTGNSPIGLPHRLITTDADGEKLYLNIQSKTDALFCQKVADEILNQKHN